MNMKLYKLLLFMMLCSCSSIDKKIFKSHKTNYIVTPDGTFVNANYSILDTINNKSKYNFIIKNRENKSMFIFSTVIENSLMFYSKNNISFKKQVLKLNSYYKNYMREASHSGIKKYNFIEIQPNNSLIIYIDQELITNIKKIELTYYYFHSNSSNSLLNINDEILSKEVVFIDI